VDVLNSTHNPWRPTVRLELGIDSRTMHNNNLKTFEMRLWLDNNLPVPVKTYIHMVRENDDGSILDLELYQEMTSFAKGTNSIVYQKPEYKPDDFLRYDVVDDSYSTEFLANWSYQPPLGSMDSSISTYFADAAITKLKTDDATKDTWSDYMSTRTDPVLLSGNVTKSSGVLNWAFTFGEYAYLGILNAEVSETGIPSASKDSLDDSPGANPKGIEEVLSFSGAENILLDSWARIGQDNAEFYPEYELFDMACDDIFTDNNGVYNLDMAQYQFGVDTQVIVPSLDFTSTTTLPQVDYGFIITQNPTTTQINSENEDFIYTVALNAETGQIVYVWEHKERQDGLSTSVGGWL